MATNNELLLKDLGICPKDLAMDYPREIDHYIGVVNWLTRYKPKFGSSPIEKTKGYKGALLLFCELQAWEKIQIILRNPLSVNSNLSLPFYEYLLFNELPRELVAIAQEILTSLENSGYDLAFAQLLKARAMSGTSDELEEAQMILEELFSKSLVGTEIHIESLAYLGMRQVNSGLYQEGIENLNAALVKIDGGEFEPAANILELKTDILETLAFSEMNASHFERAIQLYSDVITLREEQGLFHKIIAPLAHQGIIFRKIGDYNNAKLLLEKARNQAVYIENESRVVWISHHLAYVLLDQGNLDLSEKLCEFAIDGYKKIENQWGVSDCYEQKGLICLARRNFSQAKRHFSESLTIRNKIGNRHGAASSNLDLALVFWKKRNFPKAIFYVLKGFYLYYKLGILNLTRFRRMLGSALFWILRKQQ